MKTTQPEKLPGVIQKIRHCKTCEYKCDREEHILGCLSYMLSYPEPIRLEVNGKFYQAECIKRVWFNEQYQPVKLWRSPTQAEFGSLTPEEWQRTLRKELDALKQESLKNGKV